MKKTVKQIMEDAFKRVLEDHNLRVDRVNCQWIVRTDGESYPVVFEIDGQAV